MDRLDSGLKVELLFDREKGEISIRVNDVRSGEEFVINPPSDKALDAFKHPFAYRSKDENSSGVDVAEEVLEGNV